MTTGVRQESGARGTGWTYPLLVLLVAFSFSGARQAEFVAYDDDGYVLENPMVNQGLVGEGLWLALTTSRNSNWHPLTWMSHALDVELFGLDAAGHHLTSILLHGANAALLLGLLRRLTGRPWAALLAAALFALHPLRVESVAWVAERKDVLSGLFALLALHGWVRWAERPSSARYLACATALALGLLAKPMLVTLPALFLLLDLWPLDRSGRGLVSLVKEKLPLLVVVVPIACVTVVTQSAEGSTTTLERLPLLARLESAAVAASTYVGQSLWPADLAVLYPHAALRTQDVAGELLVPAVLSLALWLALFALAWRLRHRAPALGVGLLWFLVALLPVIGLVQVGLQSHADRYTYLPSIGLSLALVFGLGALVPERARRPLYLALAALTLGLVPVTRAQVDTWRDTVSLFTHATEVTERNFVAHAKLGDALLHRGELEAAERELVRALEIWPNLPEAHDSLAFLELERGRPAQALEHYHAAQALAPSDPLHALNAASVRLDMGDPDGAARELQRARAMGEDGAELHFLEGLRAQRSGDLERAADAYGRATERDPTRLDAWNNLSLMRLELKRFDEALSSTGTLLTLAPGSPTAHLFRGLALEGSGDAEGAAGAFRAALALDSSLALARARLEALGEAP